MKSQKASTAGVVRMVNVGEKPVTRREAVARGRITMKAMTLRAIRRGKVAKGDVLGAARVAGIMAAKETSRLLPLCHPLPIDEVAVDFLLVNDEPAVEITARVQCTARTGAEMEALTAVAVAALTIYDMCKPLDTSMRLEAVRLVKKSGGKSGTVILE
ncbi:MAG: cyclic pyranopterin monophosphate synthase MoaC [Chloroflexota bacterium]